MDGFPSDLSRFLGMRDRDLRAEGLFVAEGRLLATRALAAGIPVLAIAADSAAFDEAIALSGGTVPVHQCDGKTLDAVAGFPFHRGMLAIARRPRLERACESGTPSGPILVLPEITDPGNLGTLLRSCLAFGFRSAWLGARSCDPWNRKCLRASMGASFTLPLFDAGSGDLGQLVDADFGVIAAAMEEGALVAGRDGIAAGLGSEEARDVLERCIEAGRIALVLGNEHDGIPPEWRNGCTQAVRIPVSAGVDSLNVAVAGSLLMRDFSPLTLH